MQVGNIIKEHKNLIQPQQLSFQNKLYDEVIIKDDIIVSIIIPCYNQALYLKEAIDSVLNQTYKNIEVIVVDDGSKDDTSKICAEYKNNICYVRAERVGLSAARNIGVQFSKGDFIVFLDADDFLYEGAIELNPVFFFTQ